MKLSILLPTLFPDLARGAIENWRPQLRGIDHEFVVVCPREIGGDAIRWIPETAPNGSVAASQLAFRSATGDVAIMAADDVRFAAGAAEQALTAFADPDRVFPLALTYPRKERAIDFVSTLFGRLYPTFFAIGRADADRAGGFLDTSFRTVFADPDLGMRIWRAGGQVRRAAAVTRAVEDRLGNPEAATKNEAAIDRDFASFHARWAPSFDPVWGTEEGGVNLVLSAEFLPLLSPDPGTLALDGRAAARDLRIARAMTVAAWAHNAPMPRAAAEAGLTYLRWISKLSADPLQVQVSGWYWAGLGRAPAGEGTGAAPDGFPRGRGAR